MLGWHKKRTEVMVLIEAEGFKQRWQIYTEELYKKVLMTQITVMVWLFT